MSVSTLLYFVSCIVCYKLGSFNTRRPGVAWAYCRDTSRWLWKWLQS